MIALIEKAAGVPLYQIKITLKGSKPVIWRRVVIRADMPLLRFHRVIQTVMGWTDSHLHQFIAAGTFYALPDPEVADMGPNTLNERSYTVSDLAPVAKTKLVYEYDFGDDWEHEVIVEKVLPADPHFKHPLCLGGVNACPPEDCGGIYGYYDFLQALGDTKHPNHSQMKDWIGGEWDASHFDLNATNKALKRMKA